jgi:hypothetical protein
MIVESMIVGQRNAGVVAEAVQEPATILVTGKHGQESTNQKMRLFLLTGN